MSNDSTATMGRLQRRGVGMAIMVDRALLRLSATLLSVGVLFSLIAGFFHPGRENANTHFHADVLVS